jgi:hypothetical protein
MESVRLTLDANREYEVAYASPNFVVLCNVDDLISRLKCPAL